MPKFKETPGTALNALIKKHGLNYNRLANTIGISSAMVRLIARDENPVSAPVAYRLAKFFKNKPEYWLILQMDFDIAKAAGNKKLDKELKTITTVDKIVFVRKKNTKKTAKPQKKTKPAAKKTVKTKAAKSKTVKLKTAKVKASGTAGRGRPPAGNKAKKTPVVKAVGKKTAAKKSSKPAPKKNVRPVVRKPQQIKTKNPVPVKKPVSTVTIIDTTINEPQI
ncbi:MAG: HigA family addiction module antitoxin [Treponema sp.]|nr:HigA family addiction module antitoxin [Treponema sp.]